MSRACCRSVRSPVTSSDQTRRSKQARGRVSGIAAGIMLYYNIHTPPQPRAPRPMRRPLPAKSELQPCALRLGVRTSAQMVPAGAKLRRMKRECGEGVGKSRQIRDCPRNCERRATLRCHCPQTGWEGAGKQRPASQETCHPNGTRTGRGVWKRPRLICGRLPLVMLGLCCPAPMRGGR